MKWFNLSPDDVLTWHNIVLLMVALTLFSTSLWMGLLFVCFHHSWMEVGMELLQSLSLYFCIYSVLRICARLSNKMQAPMWKGVLISLFIQLLLFYPLVMGIFHLQIVFIQGTGIDSPISPTTRWNFCLLIWLVHLLYAYLSTYYLHFLLQSRKQQLELVRQRAENLEKESALLKKQLSPHFLFNSLNTLEGLMAQSNKRGRQFLSELSNVYHFLLRNANVVLLEEELEFTRSYLYMMQVRYGDVIRVQESIPDGWYNTRIPAVSIQALVENAIKHNAISEEKPLTIEISLSWRNDRPYILVSNNIIPKVYQSISQGTGTGLSNLNERYRLLNLPQINIRKNDLRFTVEIPLIQ